MNYGKKGSKKRQAELTSKGIMYGKKVRVICLLYTSPSPRD